MFGKDRSGYESLRERFPDLEAYIESRYIPAVTNAVLMGSAVHSDMCPAASKPERKKTSFPLFGRKKQEEACADEPDLCAENDLEPEEAARAASCPVLPILSEEEIMKRLSETWQESLLRMIDEKGFSDTEVYKRANVDRKLFSKIRSNASYQPKKITAVAFVLALRLDLDDAKDMLAKAGFAFSPSSRFDLIVEYFIEHEVYDLYTINLALFEHNEMLIGE